jgi:hypothetical protein
MSATLLRLIVDRVALVRRDQCLRKSRRACRWHRKRQSRARCAEDGPHSRSSHRAHSGCLLMRKLNPVWKKSPRGEVPHPARLRPPSRGGGSRVPERGRPSTGNAVCFIVADLSRCPLSSRGAGSTRHQLPNLVPVLRAVASTRPGLLLALASRLHKFAGP